VGRYVRIRNAGSDCMHLIAGARNQGGACELTLSLDPRLGEGPVAEILEGALRSEVTLQLAGQRYYHGKTLTNEDGSATLRVNGVTGRSVVWVDLPKGGDFAGKGLAELFGDRDGDSIPRFIIYDYGVGDEVSVPTVVSLRRQPDGAWLLEASTEVTVKLPGRRAVTVAPTGGERVLNAPSQGR